jgi:hypothetical protein
VILCTGVSCNSESEDESFDIQTLEITNEIINKEVINFVKEVKPPGGPKSNYHPYLTISYLPDDTVTYEIDYFGSPIFFDVESVAFFVVIDDKYVPVVIQGLMHSSEFFFRLKDDVIMEYCKRYFPKEYAYYQKKGEWPMPPTARDRYRVLTFKGDKLIKKEDKFE